MARAKHLPPICSRCSERQEQVFQPVLLRGEWTLVPIPHDIARRPYCRECGLIVIETVCRRAV